MTILILTNYNWLTSGDDELLVLVASQNIALTYHINCIQHDTGALTESNLLPGYPTDIRVHAAALYRSECCRVEGYIVKYLDCHTVSRKTT